MEKDGENSNGDPMVPPVAALMVSGKKEYQLFDITSEIAEVRNETE